jgi:hypothetical protein
MAARPDVEDAAQALRAAITRQQQEDEPGSAFALALAQVLADALSGPNRMQVATELNVGLRRQRCGFSINRRPGGNRR